MSPAVSDPPKAALVTGGARRIGRAIVEALAQAGHSVAIHCHGSRHEAEELASSLVAKGTRAHVLMGDLGDALEAARLVPAAEAAIGRLTLLVNNAALFEEDSIAELEGAGFDRHIAVNLRAPLLLARDFARRAQASSRPSVVNILDQRVLRPDPRCFSYTLTKSALWSATRTMAQAFAPAVRVNAVAPGPTFPNPRDREEGLVREAEATLLGRRVRPQAIAEAVLYLVSAEHVTGQMLAVDSGQHLGWLTPDVLATLRQEG
jgi:NAD(P)-dependent dehydrogenase (short-subunit alcohol dehydrogenase family)